MPPVTEDTGKGKGIANTYLLYLAKDCTLISTTGRRGSRAGWRIWKESTEERGRKPGQGSVASNTHNNILHRGFRQQAVYSETKVKVWLFTVKEDA